MAEQKTDAEKAAAAARDAEAKATEARAKEAEAAKSAEAKAAEKAEADADNKRAAAEQAKSEEAGKGEPDTVATAGIVAPHVDPDTAASDPLAVKRGNDPANPQPLPGLQGEPTVRLTRVTPDKPGAPVETMVHEVMVGDYLRAGWARD